MGVRDSHRIIMGYYSSGSITFGSIHTQEYADSLCQNGSRKQGKIRKPIVNEHYRKFYSLSGEIMSSAKNR